jgi:hypothetical protein
MAEERRGKDEVPHKGVTEAIIGAAIKVQRSLGPGLLLNFWAWPLKDGGIKRHARSLD